MTRLRLMKLTNTNGIQSIGWRLVVAVFLITLAQNIDASQLPIPSWAIMIVKAVIAAVIIACTLIEKDSSSSIGGNIPMQR